MTDTAPEIPIEQRLGAWNVTLCTLEKRRRGMQYDELGALAYLIRQAALEIVGQAQRIKELEVELQAAKEQLRLAAVPDICFCGANLTSGEACTCNVY